MSDWKEDHHLIRKIADGDSKAFEVLFAKYKAIVFGYLKKLTGQNGLAEDIMQDVWMSVIQNANEFKPMGSVKSWILTMAHNKVMDEFRRTKRWQMDVIDETTENELKDPAEALDELLGQKELQSCFGEVLQTLKESQRTALLMWMTEEFSNKEIGQQLGVSEGAVKQLLIRAQDSLRDEMKRRGYGKI